MGDKCPSYSAVKKWCDNFQYRNFETQDAALYEWLSTMLTPGVVDTVYKLSLANQWILVKIIAETLELPRVCTTFIINEQLGMQKPLAK